jgi:hypothetical protein
MYVRMNTLFLHKQKRDTLPQSAHYACKFHYKIDLEVFYFGWYIETFTPLCNIPLFVTGKLFQPCLKFVIEVTPVEQSE